MLAEVEDFLRDKGMAATTFGKLARRDPRFVLDLRMGRQPRARTRASVRAFMEAFDGD